MPSNKSSTSNNSPASAKENNHSDSNTPAQHSISPQSADTTVERGDEQIELINDLPSLSIRRPILVLVVNLLIALAGIAAMTAIEVRELPDIDQPVVTVRASYPGASPETIDAEVTSLLEGAVARVSGVKSMESASEENSGRVRLSFSPDTDLNTAAADVREAVSQVLRRMPDRVEQVLVIKADDDSDSIIDVAVLTDTLMEEDVTRVVEKDIIPAIISIEGVADVQLSGDRQRLLRVVVDPLRLTSYGLSVTDVANVLRQASFDVPAGSFRSEDQELVVRADASVVSAQQVADIIIRDTRRIGDVANVYFAPEDARNITTLDGRSVIGLGVVRQARSNTITISNDVRAAIEQLNQRLTDVELVITNDNAFFIRSSVQEVLTTLTLTVLIVISTIWLFMGSLRATLVPSVAIPVALIGTVAGIWLFGFSINIVTLLALVLATGLVVDDAIVVLENIQRRRSQGLGARAAAVLGTRQVFFAVVTTSVVLISVFVPISFLPSTAGRLFREFGFVLAVAVAISSFVALSLVPAMASRLPNNIERNADTENAAFKLLSSVGARINNFYSASLAWLLQRTWLILPITVLVVAIATFTYKQVDKELIPPEDRGNISLFVFGPDGVGLNYMERQTEQVEKFLQPLVDKGEIASLYSVVGMWDPNRALINAPLVDWDKRERSQQEIADELRAATADITGVRVGIRSSNSLNLRGSNSGAELEVALIGNDYGEIFQATKQFTAAIEDRFPQFSNPDISYEPTQPQLRVDVDRRRAADLGIELDNLANTLRAMIDGAEIIDLNVGDEAVPIVLEASTGQIDDPTDLVNLYVSGHNGNLLPLSSVVTLKEEGIAAELDRHAQRRAIEVDVEVEPGYPLQSAINDLQTLADEVLPNNVSMILLGDAATLEETSREVALTYAIAFAVVFLVLCAQFEGFSSAIVITLIIPFGIAAAIFALFVTGTSINIYSQIGLVMLIGLMAKNGILLVEFADQLRDRGYDVLEAIQTGAKVRLRPVAMTIISTVLGGLPLVLSTGAGAEARTSIGWVVFGGLGIAALFTLYLTPVLYVLISRFSKARAHEEHRLNQEMKSARELQEQH